MPQAGVTVVTRPSAAAKANLRILWVDDVDEVEFIDESATELDAGTASTDETE